MKTCVRCDELTNNFTPYKKAKDGLRSWCRPCVNTWNKQYTKTKLGHITRMYNNQKTRSKHRKHPIPTYTKKDLLKWCLSQNKFHKLYDNWKSEGYPKRLAPSCDRTDDDRGYSLDRLQLMTWEDNLKKTHKDMREGKLKHGHKPQKVVIQCDLRGNSLAEFHSLNEACRKTGINVGGISQMCNMHPKYKTVGGFKWKFKKVIQTS